MGWKHTAYYIINSDPGHTRSNQELDKTLKITFVSLSKSTDGKEKEKKREAIPKRYALRANAITKKCKCFHKYKELPLKAVKSLKITYAQVNFQQSLLKDSTFSKLIFRQITFLVSMSHVIEFA